MRVLFAHGKEGSNQGEKATFLRKEYDAFAPNLRGLSLEDQAQVLAHDLEGHENTVLVGSSMGAAAAVLASRIRKPDFLVLLAPALHLLEDKTLPEGLDAEIIHGDKDELIPIADVFQFGVDNKATVCQVFDGHRLSKSHDEIRLVLEGIKREITYTKEAQ